VLRLVAAPTPSWCCVGLSLVLSRWDGFATTSSALQASVKNRQQLNYAIKDDEVGATAGND